MDNTIKRTFVSNSIYHIYLSIIYILKDSNYDVNAVGDNILFLLDRKGIDKKMIPFLESHFFRKVYLIPTFDIQKKGIGKINSLFFRRYSIVPYMEKIMPELVKEESFITESQIIVSNPCSAKSYFLYKYPKKSFHGIEDGARDYRKIHTSWKIFLRNNITKKPLEGGDDRRIKTFYAQFPNKLPKKLRKKTKELNALKVIANLNNEAKKKVFYTFAFEPISDLKPGKNAIIITQPISENNIVASETDKIAIYQEIITSIEDGFHIVLKMHPRETTDYSKYFKSITIFGGSFPLEILSLGKDVYFDKGFTLFSTSINNIDIIGEKYIVGDKFSDYYTTKRWKNKIKQTVNQFK
ncbi:glycosyltransferase family 52 [Maribacter sp. TH_r10]|uniref:glycosyltransferase family 52 n=1 Tax=Maribacter sp. TH_r10 TaxID=3082086 RepID=UPI0029545F27|nr:glycosyltransferase family 52 [Maribacter sp. TH_r10]MDV7139639.1 glycosyltransferase family 52 [Maribacter sp. TH_r10]